MKLVYVAGPITIPEPMENVHRALKVGDRLLESGKIAPIVPHLTCFWQVFNPRDYEAWLAYDFELIRRCDAVYRMPGESSGADREVDFAGEQRIPVFFDVDELIAWA